VQIERVLGLFSGHFAPEQIEMIEGIARAWNACEGTTLRVGQLDGALAVVEATAA
jgi:hypothetical protein